MIDDEEILNLRTNKPKIIKLEDFKTFASERSPLLGRKRIQHFILYVVDSIISLVFVAPMAIAFWRGTWGLLDIHTHIFPPYATGVLGIIIHMCFVLMRQFIKDYFDDETERAKRDPIFVIARRLYTYTYSVMSVMQWRGCWTAFDQLFVEKDNITWTVLATLVSTFSLIILKSLTNSLATPCILILDSLDACYNIPTRYRVVGHVPSPFSTAIIDNSTMIPKNIQDVINNSEKSQILDTSEESQQQSRNVLSSQVYIRAKTEKYDPFYAFKPQDIAEVNLLAVSNVRFAPPQWIDLNRENQRRRLLKRSQRNIAQDKIKYNYFHRNSYKMATTLQHKIY
ncbi:fuseless isoform a [Holotrichia oblita]|uniref:Fuseless isoform a n=1 Tax=Holotrichia oblita TaxID=644536 RepID=A0ACB9T4B4_HOLOL|nr:fuseless isoform a [Holotrichia oblita]